MTLPTYRTAPTVDFYLEADAERERAQMRWHDTPGKCAARRADLERAYIAFHGPRHLVTVPRRESRLVAQVG